MIRSLPFMDRQTVIPALFLSLVLSFGAAAQPAAPKPVKGKPNIVIIFTDDQGYADLSCYDNPGDIKTPNIDRIAKNGVKLTDGYSTHPVCGPSRAGLMSGRYQQRFGYCSNRDVFNPGFLQQTTLPQVLKKSGYVTGMVGKWHLGRREEKRWPNHRGFDEFYGFLYSMRGYFPIESKNNPLYRNTKPEPDPDAYLTDTFNKEAVAFVDKHAGKKPFFLYLSYNAPHYPLEAKEEDIKLFNTGDERRDVYLAMMKSVDEGVGQLYAKLDEKGVTDNTLIFFLSDNGGLPDKGGRNGVLRGKKGEMFEGGIRVPFLVSWPEELPKGKVSKVPVMAFDIFATSVAAAGGKMPEDGKTYDSRDMLPFLKGGKEGYLRPTLYWGAGGENRWAIRHHDWKLVSSSKKKDEIMLFDLKNDVGETTDLTAKHPEKVKELQAMVTAWRKEVIGQTVELLGENWKDNGKW